MTEQEAKDQLYADGIWQLAPGLWCNKANNELIPVHPDHDNALSVYRALKKERDQNGSAPD